MTCLFCDPPVESIFFSCDQYYCLWDGFPVANGHALVIPKRHFPSWFEATPTELSQLLSGIVKCREKILEEFSPSGFNIGVNVGSSAGQTIEHMHVHVIPRYEGDVQDPRGGIRNVIPEKGNYLVDNQLQLKQSFSILGDIEKPLGDTLVIDLENANQFDLAVAFVTDSGLLEIEPAIRSLLERDGRVRFLTGDYLGVTEPKALHLLLDLQQSYPGKFESKFFETNSNVGFHPKAYILKSSPSNMVTYIGSSNLTRHALLSGIEWNQRSQVPETSQQVISEEYERLFLNPAAVPLDADVIDRYSRTRDVTRLTSLDHGVEMEEEILTGVPTPNEVQREALTALCDTRDEGNMAGLVVLATGIGKTWLAAFDSLDFGKVLFVAHREEILNQAQGSFRRIRPDADFGRFGGGSYDENIDVLFASIQTLGKQRYLDRFATDAFDYIVVDEFHHASAKTYRRLIDHFEPKFLLGLTATPERSDGGDLLSLCGENLVYRCDLHEGVRRELLCPFHYFGVADEVDFQNIPWRSGKFDPTQLEAALATSARAKKALTEWREKSQERTLAFCVSVRHADFMRDYFTDRGVRAVSVHSGEGSASRTQSLADLEAGTIDVIFTVDMFNEGVDLPSIDTVLMLRPTESKIMWLQQLGRGLRKWNDKKLNIIDFIGNHRTFLQSALILLESEGSYKGDVLSSLAALMDGSIELPPGCFVEYDLESINILRALAQPSGQVDQVIHWFRVFTELNGRRPLANEAWHEGYDPKKVRSSYASWFGLVESEQELTAEESSAFTEHRALLESIETTQMTKSFKMVTLLAMIADEAFPGSISIDRLVDQVLRIASRIKILHNEFGPALGDRRAMKKLLEDNPISAWVGGKGTSKVPYFSYENGSFSTNFDSNNPAGLVSLVQEICDYRLSQYIARSVGETKFAADFECRVAHSGGSPILFLPSRQETPGIPSGWMTIKCDDQEYQANFVKIAINVIRSGSGDEKVNHLPSVLRNWFGEEAGQPGRNEVVRFHLKNGLYQITPLKEPALNREWKEYMRAEIPPLFGLEFSTAKWNQGYVVDGDHQFLLVTLNKEGMSQEHQYEDKFISPTEFQWMSQNRTKRESAVGQRIANHKARDSHVHLFIRDRKKTPNGSAAPFTYIGEVNFMSWEGDSPIKVRWKLNSSIPGSIYSRFAS